MRTENKVTRFMVRCCTKGLVSAVVQILKGNTYILGSSPSLGLRPLFFWVGFYDWP